MLAHSPLPGTMLVVNEVFCIYNLCAKCDPEQVVVPGCGARFYYVKSESTVHMENKRTFSTQWTKVGKVHSRCDSPYTPSIEEVDEKFGAESSVLDSRYNSSSDESLNIDPPTRENEWEKIFQNSDWELLYISLMKFKCQKSSLSVAFVMNDDQNISIVHQAVRKAPNALILLLLDVLTSCPLSGQNDISPEARTKQYLLLVDNDGNTPLHLACSNLQLVSKASGDRSIDFSVIKNLLLLGHAALGIQNNVGDTPFHLIVASSAFRELSVIVEKAAVEATLSILSISKHLNICPLLVRNNEGFTPIHICAKLNSPTLLTQTLLKSDASVATVVSKCGKTPLRLAMSTLVKVGCNRSDVVGLRNALANVAALATPEACMVLDSNKQIPLMTVVQNKKWSTVLARILLSAHPESASFVNPEGFIALHFACQNKKVKLSTVKGTWVVR